MISNKQQRKNAFSLLEVVIVVAIIAILAAIGIPRMSRGSQGAADSALKGNLAILRNSLELYAAEHQGAYPTADNIEDQLTRTTNDQGSVGTDEEQGYIYGPYLRKIPTLPVGYSTKGNSGIADANGEGVGWIYDVSGQTINANTDKTDVSGNSYGDPNHY